MKTVNITCPFTGVDFDALVSDDNTIIFISPVTGETFTMKRDGENYLLPEKALRKHDLVTLKETAQILEVTKQRVSKIVKNGTIPVKRVNGNAMFLRSDVLNYKHTRKVGAPFKEKNND